LEPNEILIVGGGLVGQTLADRLSRDGHDVTVVERDPERARLLSEKLDVQVVEGNGSTVPVLRTAGIETADLVVAATQSDEANVVVGLLASQVFETARVVVRVRDEGHEEGFVLSRRGGLTDHVCVNPDRAAVDRIEALLEVPGAVDVMRFFDGELLVAGFRIAPQSDFAGLRVSDMNLLFASTPTLAVAIQRGERWIVPGGAEQIEAGDLVHFAIARRDLQDMLSLVGVPPSRRGRIMVAGATSIGLALARRLKEKDVRVVLLEADRERAEHAAAELDHVLVLHGAATDRALLVDEEVEHVSHFVAVTADHESNLVSGLLARRLGAGRSIVLLDNPALVTLVGEIGIDSIISERLLTIGLALQSIRGGGVRSGAALLGDEVEIIEVEAKADTRLVSAPLAKVGLPRGVLIAALRRGEELLVPRGPDRVEPGDRVLIVALADGVGKLVDYFER
jgi:trk system potassium uptake protein TrkA